MKEEAERIRLENQALMKKEREEQEKQSKRPAAPPQQQDSGEEQKQQQPPQQQQQQQQQQAGAPKTPAGRSVGRTGSCVDMVACSNIGMENCNTL